MTGGVTREAREKIEAAGKATKARVENMMEGFECDVERQRARLVRLFDAKKKAADSSRRLRRSTRRIKRKDRSEDGDLIFSQEEMTLEQFKEWKSVMSEVNKEFTKKRTEDSKPALSQLDLTAEEVGQLQSVFYKDDGSLRREVMNDIDLGTKNDPRYIDFANPECLTERKDRRWQVPSKCREKDDLQLFNSYFLVFIFLNFLP